MLEASVWVVEFATCVKAGGYSQDTYLGLVVTGAPWQYGYKLRGRNWEDDLCQIEGRFL